MLRRSKLILDAFLALARLLELLLSLSQLVFKEPDVFGFDSVCLFAALSQRADIAL